MANTVDLSHAWGLCREASSVFGMPCRTPAFPYPEMPRTVANSGGSTGVQGLSPGTPFFPPGKKPSVFGFFFSFTTNGGRQA
jgi:hypothetical protein